MWTQAALTACPDAPPELRALALYTSCHIPLVEGRKGRCEEALAAYQTLQDKRGILDVLRILAWEAFFRGDFREAESLAGEAVALARELVDYYNLSDVLGLQGHMLAASGDTVHGRALLEDSLEVAHQSGRRFITQRAITRLASLARQQGDYQEAERLFEEALATVREINDRAPMPALLCDLGELALYAGRLDRARELLVSGLEIAKDNGDVHAVARCVEGVGCLAQVRGSPLVTATAFGAADRLRGMSSRPWLPGEREISESYLQGAREALGDAAFYAAWAEGQTKTLEEAVEYALAWTGETR